MAQKRTHFKTLFLAHPETAEKTRGKLQGTMLECALTDRDQQLHLNRL